MSIKITFHNMPHSNALESHAREKIDKILHASGEHVLHVEMFLHAQRAHTEHHSVELHVKSEHFNLSVTTEKTDMYTAVDTAVETMVQLTRKERKKLQDKKQKVVTDKTAFAR